MRGLQNGRATGASGLQAELCDMVREEEETGPMEDGPREEGMSDEGKGKKWRIFVKLM